MQQILLEKTRSHYDEFPFIEGGANRIGWWREYLRDFLPDEEIQDRLIIDVGSSVGEISRGLIERGARLVCLDLSLESVRRCKQLNPQAETFHGNALDLPFPDNTFDHGISIGVLHHTPDCRLGFKELARVTAPGGTIVVFLYNYWSIYNLIYHAFKPVRERIPLNRVPGWLVSLLQPFVKSHLGQHLNEQQLRNLLGDKLWTPQATFHAISEIRDWAVKEGLKLIRTKRFFLGYANVMKFKKEGRSNMTIHRDVVLRCNRCRFSPVVKHDTEYTCGLCGYVAPNHDGIIRYIGL